MKGRDQKERLKILEKRKKYRQQKKTLKVLSISGEKRYSRNKRSN